MAENLQFLKRRIKTASNIAQIAKAMEMISASKIKKAQDAVQNNRPYSEKITEVLEKALSSLDLEKFNHPYLKNNSSDKQSFSPNKKLLIVMSPDKGLAGALPTNLIKKLLVLDSKDTYLITIGKKVEKIADRLNAQLVASFPLGTSLPNYSMVYPLIDLINQHYLENKVSEINILYTEFKSIFSQVPEVIRLLPFEINKEKTENKETQYTFEPGAKAILEELLPYYLEVKLYNYLIQAYTSEQAARMVAMQNAKNNALDIAEYLTLSYNKARQSIITNELLDLANVQYA
ncbi:ATP synthase F1 subunit gamma [Patescibacteria group bacterium]|nr:ATP synthase F1 subunit gamma [Patescibacteria group bacterium]